jgi:predicted nucleic acid-binding Zn ribbon protein
MTYTLTCLHCKKAFEAKTDWRVYCSRECQRAHVGRQYIPQYARMREAPFKPKRCGECSQEFVPKSPTDKYCSDACKHEAMLRRERLRGRKVRMIEKGQTPE